VVADRVNIAPYKVVPPGPRGSAVRARRTTSGLIIRRGWFDRVVREYRPLTFEVVEPTALRRFSVPMHNVLKNRDRFWFAIKVASRYFPAPPFTVADLGTYPGSLLRLLHLLLPPKTCRPIGAGLMTSEDFRRTMAEDCAAEILTVNLDPRNDVLRGKGYPTRIPVEDGGVDFIFALEMVEHLTSPSHLFAEAFRICAPGGYLLVTTPNVTRIGNVMKLLIGRSNFDRLIPLDYENPEDEWRPHFREYSMPELCDFFRRAGFQVVEARHFVGEDTHYNEKSMTQRLIDLAKLPFYTVPHLRATLLVLGRKPARSNE
jgi:SAM-dependent methyltransferase